MPNNILITPASASIQFSGSAANTIRLQVEQSGSVAFYGNSGTLFGITDSLSGSLMSVNDISGLPILEVFSDDRVVMGTFNSNALVVTGSRVGVDTATPTSTLHVAGTVAYGSVRISPTSANGESAIAFFTDTAGTDTNDAWVVGHAAWGNTNDFVIGNENNAAGGNVRLLIEKAGNVGIGTTSPAQKLDVNGAVNALYMGVNPSGTSNNGYGISLYGGASTSPTYGIFFQGTGTYGTYGNVTADWATYFTMDGTTNRGWIFRNMSNSTNIASINNAGYATFVSLGVGTAASGTGGEIRATHEVTAYYSDARLKNFHGKILNAGEKVALLNGYYFTENETAKSLGYTNDKMQIGVSAQEVQAVLPEAVVPAPIDENYLTVKYEKLVPLLIEAIKELQAEVAILKAQKT